MSSGPAAHPTSPGLDRSLAQRRADERIYLAGHRGMLGSALLRRLGALGYTNILTADRTELDLTSQSAVADYFQAHRVIPALIRRFHEAVHEGRDEVVVWGSGRPRREFLHVDDMAAAGVHVMELSSAQWQSVTEPMRAHLNVGTGKDCSIGELAGLVAEVTGFRGQVSFDSSMPDGTPRKLLDVSRLEGSGWSPRVGLADGLRDTYRWFLAQPTDLRI